MEFTKSPTGEKVVVLTEAEYDALLDARDAAVGAAVMARIQKGEEETFSPEEATAYLEAPTPLAFWRKHRGLTQKALADAVGISQSYVADLESGRRQGNPSLLLRLAKVLGTSMESLVDV